MPAPIPISATPSQLDSFGSPRVGSLTGAGSFKEFMAGSFGRDVSDIMDYSISRLATSTDSDVTMMPSSSRLESTFCRNFTCCGQALDDLHDLLQHYEECHVRFDDEEMPAMVPDDDMDSSSSSSSSSSQPPSPRAATITEMKRKAAQTFDSFEDNSAFDTAIVNRGKKRSFGQFNSNNNPAVHQSLRRALIDGGIGARRGANTPSIYSANSPFSTPGSSMPGTPIEHGNEDAFFGAGANAPAFSSLSLRAGAGDDHLPSCAPPNLFFPASGTASNGFPASKRERFNHPSVTMQGTGAPESHISRPGATLVVDKPYKCPAPGCDKAYKQMNGLKYHRLHGHCNQNNMPIQPQTAAAAAAQTPNHSSPQLVVPRPSPQGSVSPSLPGSPTSTAPSSPRLGNMPQPDKMYLCQVGACGKRYKNLNGLRYHYLHSGSHGLLGLQLLHANGGGASAKVDATGRPAVSTQTLSSAAVAAAAQAAAAQQQAQQAQAHAARQQLQQQQAPAITSNNINSTVFHPALPLGPQPSLN